MVAAIVKPFDHEAFRQQLQEQDELFDRLFATLVASHAKEITESSTYPLNLDKDALRHAQSFNDVVARADGDLSAPAVMEWVTRNTAYRQLQSVMSPT